MYNLPAPVGFSCTRILGLKDDRVFFKRGRLFLKRGHVFKKDGHLFFVVYDVCRKYPVYHTPIFIVSLQLVFPVYEMQVVFGKSPVYTCARINIKVGCFVDRNRRLEICSTAYFENQ